MKSWTCIENYGACYKFNLSERRDLTNNLKNGDIELINSTTSYDAWGKYIDRKNKQSLIYESRSHFCGVNEFLTAFKGYLKSGDKFLIDFSKQNVSPNYGYRSIEMENTIKAVLEK